MGILIIGYDIEGSKVCAGWSPEDGDRLIVGAFEIGAGAGLALEPARKDSRKMLIGCYLTTEDANAALMRVVQALLDGDESVNLNERPVIIDDE